MKLPEKPFWTILITLDVLLIALSFTPFMSPYFIHLLILLHLYGLLATSLNLAVGYTGLLNLGHIALMGIGAYTSTLLVINGVSFFLALPLAMLATAFCAFLLMFATKNLKQDYFALATLGFSFVVFTILLNWIEVTKGARGISGIPPASIFGFAIQNTSHYLLFTFVLVGVSLLILSRIIHSPFGRLFEAVRDDETSLQVMGKNTTLLKLQCVAISGLFVGLVGSLFAHYIGFIDPFSFSITEIILIFTVIIVGGLASFKGSLAGTIVILLLPELLRLLPLPGDVLGPLRLIAYAILLIAILLFKPRGIFGRIDLT